jgi:hypothetical protein
MAREFPKLLNENAAADLIGVRPQTLSVWRSTKRYPLPYVRVGRLIYYRESDLLAFLDSRLVTPLTVDLHL